MSKLRSRFWSIAQENLTPKRLAHMISTLSCLVCRMLDSSAHGAGKIPSPVEDSGRRVLGVWFVVSMGAVMERLSRSAHVGILGSLKRHVVVVNIYGLYKCAKDLIWAFLCSCLTVLYCTEGMIH